MRGVGCALVAALHAHMREQGIRSVWVAADSEEAQAFYRACGYDTDELLGVILSRTLDS